MKMEEQMREKDIGRVIYTLRIQGNVYQEYIIKGLCSLSALSRIENCSRVPDKLLFDALLQRIGKSPDKIECILTNRDYILYQCREDIIESICSGNPGQAKKLINEYMQENEYKKEPLHTQFINQMRAIIMEMEQGRTEESRRLIEEAIHMTLPEFRFGVIGKQLFSVTELNLILMYMKYREEDQDEILAFVDDLNRYVVEHYSDEEERVKIYPKIVILEAGIYFSRGMYEEADAMCCTALELLGNNGILRCMPELISLRIKCLQHLSQPEEMKRMKNWLETLKDIYAEHGFSIYNEYDNILLMNTKGEILLINEIIRKSRKSKGYTQDKLSENICTPENLSAIESGRRAPTIKNYEKFIEKLGISLDYYNCYISTNKFEVFEMRRECDRLITLQRYEEAQKISRELEKQLDMNNLKNRQYIQHKKIFFAYRNGKIDAQKALNEYQKILELTHKPKSEINDYVIFSVEEIKILNSIAIMYKKMGNRQRAITIFNKALETYRTSKVRMSNHYIGNILLMSNLCMYLEEENRVDESMDVGEEGIKLVLTTGRNSMLAMFLANACCCMEKKDPGNKKAAIKYLQQAFYISDMINDNHRKDIIKYYASNKYNIKMEI